MKKKQNIIKLWITAKYLYSIAIIFWLIETIIFLVIYGWHVKAICVKERVCDFVVGILMYSGIFCTLIVLFSIIDYLLSKQPEPTYTIPEIRKSLEPLINKSDLEFYLRQIEIDKYHPKT